ncbi:MAG: hypothetical protein QM790_08980 [Nibricoccus sp.]
MKTLSLLGFSMFVAAVAWGADSVLPATGEYFSEKPVLLPEMRVSEKTERRKVYEAKVEVLSSSAFKRHSISYVEVLEAAYDTSKFDLVKCLLEKKAYRETVAKDQPFYCNYGAANVEVKINWRSSEKGVFGGVMTRGSGATTKGLGFDYTTREITLSPDAPFQFLLHASGAALSGFPSKKTAAAMKERVGKKEADAVSKHVEFELQLQDLNRYYATFTGAPIMSPLDAVHALAMFGHTPHKDIVLKILKRHGLSANDAQLAKALSSEKVKRDGRAGVFELAYRLVDGYSALGYSDAIDAENDGRYTEDLVRYQVADGLNQKDHAEYEAMLERIIIEAPGHI